MKQGQPLKRTELKRNSALKSNGRGLARTTELKPGKRKSKAKIPKEIREAVYRRTGGKCVRPGCEKRAVHPHHWLSQSDWPELAKIEANMSGICFDCHMAHHFSPNGRLPYSAIPGCTFRLAASLGPRAQSFLGRHYPRKEV